MIGNKLYNVAICLLCVFLVSAIPVNAEPTHQNDCIDLKTKDKLKQFPEAKILNKAIEQEMKKQKIKDAVVYVRFEFPISEQSIKINLSQAPKKLQLLSSSIPSILQKNTMEGFKPGSCYIGSYRIRSNKEKLTRAGLIAASPVIIPVTAVVAAFFLFQLLMYDAY